MAEGLSPISTEQAAAILAEAFAEDPVMQYFTDGVADDARDALRQRIMALLVRFHHDRGQALWGWQHNGRMVGAAMVEGPQGALRLIRAVALALPRLLSLPLRTLLRLNAYGRRSAAHRPAGRHCFLVMIGLGDAARGKGVGSRFLTALHAQYDSALPWVLDTENPANLVFYRRFGYQLYATDSLGPVSMFKLARPAHSPLPEPFHENQP